MDQNYASAFGFTETEVDKILTDSQQLYRENEIKDWYNGYNIGNQTIYNPWSLLSVAVKSQEPLNSYWINTAQDKLIEDLITQEFYMSLQELTCLLRGETLVKEINPSVVLSRIDGQSIWSLLLFSGYLTLSEERSETHYALKLPNREVRGYFEHIVRRWLAGSKQDLDSLRTSLIQGNLPALKEFIHTKVMRLVGQNDTRDRSNPENFYHGLMLGLVAYRLDDIYIITSNRESGQGRYDLQLAPREPGLPGYIFEFKSMKKGDEHDLKEGSEMALTQIQERQYAQLLKEQGVSPLWLVGISFHGKELELLWRENSLPAPTK